MNPEVFACPADTPLELVAEIMAVERVHCVVVEPTEPDDDAWVILSDRDLMAAAASGRPESTAAAAAVSEFLTVTPEEPLRRAVQIMVERDTSHLVVVDPRSNRALGVISTFDVARTLAAG
jgi:CBS domain-containing protein